MKVRCLLGLCLWAVSVQADPIRRLWYLEHLALPFEAQPSGKSRHQLGLDAMLYPDAASTRAKALVDLDFIDIGFVASQRLFFSSTSEGVALKSGLAGESRAVGMEIGRYRVNSSGLHGRISAAILSFSPNAPSFWKLTLATGALPSAQLPWDFRLAFSFFLSFDHRNDFTVLRAETARHYVLGSGFLDVGGFLSWGQALRSAPTEGESMQISLGPTATYTSAIGKLSLSIPLRVWIDRALVGATLAYRSDFGNPSIALGWQIPL